MFRYALIATLALTVSPLVAFAADSTPVPEAEKPKEPVDPGAKSALLTVKPDDIVIGKKDAPVTIVEYSSLSCPHCAHFHDEILPKIEKDYIAPGKAKLVVRAFPLNKPAFDGAKLVACAGPERAPKFIEVLFKLQDKWAYSMDDEAALQKIAAVGGIPEERFKQCLADKEVEAKILKSRQDATEILQVESTPTFFVNGEKISGAQDEPAFAKAIDAATPKK